MFLRFRETDALFQRPFIIIGILTEDLDRSLFTVREAPKPYFQIEQGQLVLKGTPLPGNTEEWLKGHPPSINSYLLALLTQKYRLATGGFNWLEWPYEVPEKKLINTKIIEEMVKEAQSHHLPLLFVIFYAQQELKYEGWRELFLKDLLARLQVPYVDTKRLLLAKAAEHAIDTSEFYYRENSHPNVIANCLVAEAIDAYLANNLKTEILAPDTSQAKLASNLFTIDSILAGIVSLDQQIKTPWPVEVSDDPQGSCFDRSFLWLGQGEQQGLSGALWSTKTQTVRATIGVEPGPARADSQRTLALTLENKSGAKAEVRQFDQAAALIFKSELQPGLNKFSVKVLDEASVPKQPNGDTRPVLVLLHQIKVTADSY
ncbi:MAG: hypothetical protein HYR94_27740 [Chloroflexi bacterium]|nr:hypothetical protein [Chloroflexota bacterium]